MKKSILLFICCFLMGTLGSQTAAARLAGGAWNVVGSTEAKHNEDHDAIVLKPVANFKKLKVTVRNVGLTIIKLNIVYDSGEEETIDAPMMIPKNGESGIVDINSGTRGIKRIDFWYDSTEFTSGKAEVTIFGRK